MFAIIKERSAKMEWDRR